MVFVLKLYKLLHRPTFTAKRPGIITQALTLAPNPGPTSIVLAPWTLIEASLNKIRSTFEHLVQKKGVRLTEIQPLINDQVNKSRRKEKIIAQKFCLVLQCPSVCSSVHLSSPANPTPVNSETVQNGHFWSKNKFLKLQN